MERDTLKFAAFVMTYKRQAIAKQTVEALFNQTVPPEKLLIIDNDKLQSGKIIQEQLGHLPITYYAVGFNSGPAGAAAIGLKLLAEEGYQWIAWIDDDDPPAFKDVLEKLLYIVLHNPKCGCVGVAGQFFNRQTGLIERINNSEIADKGFLEVDFIAGGMIKIVNGIMIKEYNILPEEKYFFGFEDLDLDLKIKKTGYSLIVDKELYLRHRNFYNRLNFKNKTHKKTERQLVRDYYSSRNILNILYKNGFFSAIVFTLFRIFFKCLSHFRYGILYGLKNCKYQIGAIIHFIIRKYGKTI